MAVHLSHKLRWDSLADYHTSYVDPGIHFPSGDCGLIHVGKKKHAIQAEMRNYITDDMICKDENCATTGEKTIRKNNKKAISWERGPEKDESKLQVFAHSFYNAVQEFALTEMKSPAKPVELRYEDTVGDETLSLTHCENCNKFIHCLEFGDKQRLLAYSESEVNNLMACAHGGQGVGRNIPYILWSVLRFYLYSNLIVYLNLKKEDQWPRFMQTRTYDRAQLLHAHDGQTFLPHSRHLLQNAMIDLNDTRELSKRLFRFIYLYVMVRMNVDSSYRCQDDDCLRVDF